MQRGFSLGCVIPPLAADREFTQPRQRLFDELCILKHITDLFDACQPALLRRAGGDAEAAVPLRQVSALEGEAVVRALVLALARLPDLAQFFLLGLLCGSNRALTPDVSPFAKTLSSFRV